MISVLCYLQPLLSAILWLQAFMRSIAFADQSMCKANNDHLL